MFKHSQLESVKAWLTHPDHVDLPLYARIQRAIRQLILDGALGAGKPLPASRALARSLEVSRDTVETAYTQLHAEGYIERRVGSGSFVSERTRLSRRGLARRAPAPKPLVPELSRRGSAMYDSGGVREALSPRPFSPGIPETRLFPLPLWTRLERQVLKKCGTTALLHSDPQGTEVLRRAIADYVNLERGGRATPERVLVLTSSQQGMTLCAQNLMDAGDAIFIEDPAYYGARRAFDAAGLKSIPIAVDRQGLQVEQLQQTPHPARAVFLTPSHQFPSGATLSLDRRLALIEWARQHNAWIIEDDYDSEFHYAGKPTACVQGLDPYDRTIYIGTFTKSLFPGLRIGYLVLPPQLVQPLTTARTLIDGHSAPLPQLTLARFMESGHFSTYVRQMRALYAERLRVLVDLVQQHLTGFVEPRPPVGGLQMPCVLTCNIPEADVITAARRQGLDLMGLSGLHASGTGTRGFLLGFAAYTAEELNTAVRTLAQVFRKLLK